MLGRSTGYFPQGPSHCAAPQIQEDVREAVLQGVCGHGIVALLTRQPELGVELDSVEFPRPWEGKKGLFFPVKCRSGLENSRWLFMQAIADRHGC